MEIFTNNVLRIIRRIKKGKVMTYGQIAVLAGNPKGARQVVRILHAMSAKHRLPWHRVVNARGMIAIKDSEGAMMQKVLLESEGVSFYRNRLIDLSLYRDTAGENCIQSVQQKIKPSK